MRSLRVLLLIAVAAVAVAQEDSTFPAYELEPAPEFDVEVLGARTLQGRTFKDWSKKIWKWMGYDDYDYEEYDYYYPPTGQQYGNGYPSVGYVAPSAGGQHSTYSSYTPVQVGHQQFAHPARDDDYDDDWSLTDMMFDMAVTIVPIGLLLSALPAGLFTFAIRRRSLDDASMMIDSLDPSDINRIIRLLKSDLSDRRCQEELFCELSRVGEHPDASYLQKAFYYVSTLTPDFIAGRYGLETLFRTTRSGLCQAMECPYTSGLVPPKQVHQPTDTNQIDEVVTDGEVDAVEVSKE